MCFLFLKDLWFILDLPPTHPHPATVTTRLITFVADPVLTFIFSCWHPGWVGSRIQVYPALNFQVFSGSFRWNLKNHPIENEHHLLGGGFKHFLFSPLPGEMIQFDKYFSKGLKPPTRK